MKQKRILALALALLTGLALAGCAQADVAYDGVHLSYDRPGAWSELDTGDQLAALGTMGNVTDQMAYQYGSGQNACIAAVIEGAGITEIMEAYISAYTAMEGYANESVTVGDIDFSKLTFQLSGLTNVLYVGAVDENMILFNFSGTSITTTSLEDTISNLTAK